MSHASGSGWAQLSLLKDARVHHEVLMWFAQRLHGRGFAGFGHSGATGVASSTESAPKKTYAIDKIRANKGANGTKPQRSSLMSSSSSSYSALPKTLPNDASMLVPLYVVVVAEIFESELHMNCARLFTAYPSANYLLLFSRSYDESNEDMINVKIHGAVCSVNLYRGGLSGISKLPTVSIGGASIVLLKSVLHGGDNNAAVTQVPYGQLRLDLTSPQPPHANRSSEDTCDCASHTTMSLATRSFTTSLPNASSAPVPISHLPADVSWVCRYITSARNYIEEVVVADALRKDRPRKPESAIYFIDQLEHNRGLGGTQLAFRIDELAYYLGYLKRLFEMGLFIQEVAQRGESALSSEDDMRAELHRLETYALEANLTDPLDRERDYKCRHLAAMLALRFCMKGRSRRLAVRATADGSQAVHTSDHDLFDAPAQLLLRAIETSIWYL